MAHFLIDGRRLGDGSSSLRSVETQTPGVIELIGVPGAGKTTVARILEDILSDEGLIPYDVVSAARVYARRTLPGRILSRLLAGSMLSKALWGVYLAYTWAYVPYFGLRNLRLVRHVVATQRQRPIGADLAERKVLFWYARLMGSYGFLTARARPGEVLILDEGFVHRVVQLHSSDVESPSVTAIEEYLRLVPVPTAVIHVTAPLELCIDRIRGRGVFPRYHGDDGTRLTAFLESAKRAVEAADTTMAGSSWPLHHVDNTGNVSSIRRTLVNMVRSDVRVEHGSAPSRRATLDGVYLPRPGFIREHVEASVRPPATGPKTAEDVLHQFGHERVSGIANLPMGWRNRNVLVETEHGERVLRQYPERWTLDAIRVEHSILGRLAEADFPAPRLVATSGGETLITHGGSNWALYEKLDGSNLGAHLIRPRERVRLAYLAGQLLARLHRELIGFIPNGRHHLGFEGYGDQSSPDVSWYLATLQDLVDEPGDFDGAETLKLRAQELGDRLSRLCEAMTGSPASKTVIHGDYGFHNLLFRRDDTASVVDFELARIDLRLIDLVRMLSRQPHYAGKSFAAGYRVESRISVEEWRLLPEVWEFYRLSGAVRSWRLAREIGDHRRFVTAQSRVDEAAWISENRLAPWGGAGHG